MGWGIAAMAAAMYHIGLLQKPWQGRSVRVGREAVLLAFTMLWRPGCGFRHSMPSASLVQKQAGAMVGTTALQRSVENRTRNVAGRRALESSAAVDQAGAGLAIAALSAFFNGSFPACARLPQEEPDPVIFNGIVCLGVFVSSLLVPVFVGYDVQFILPGALGGALFVFAALCSFLAIPRAGLATAQAVWSCSAIAVAFTWGAFGPAEVASPVKDLTLSFVALGLLVAGALVIVTCSDLAEKFGRADSSREQPLLEGGPDAAERVSGLGLAASVGLFGGSILVPLKFVPAELSGLPCVPSFGLGALVTGFLVTALYWYASLRPRGQAAKVAGDTLGAGVLSGAIWNAGNICSIVAQEPPFSLSYGIAYPILQCALFFGGLWGIYVFKEIRGFAVSIFWVGAAVLVAGIVLLASYGPGAA
mmetsp:Transcript_62535/g.116261  ORF Transcript_62535/g.116261 Transcript_62535/m.116261 type:complete len:419 (+) Transcript_62535:80-1336(+)